AYPEEMKALPEKDLIYAPFNSKLGQDYFKAMCAAANFAWTNRHIIAHLVRKSFKQVLGDSAELRTVYDVAHNIAKIEEHEVGGVKRKLIVHRKGATRAFPPLHEDLPDDYKKTGQPIIIPGSMGTASYVLAGTGRAMEETFGSTAHGAGRVMSRHEANKRFRGDAVREKLAKENIYVKSASYRGVSEEAPGVYKDIDDVVKVSHQAGIGRLVVRLRPLGVIKG
ncbi:RNA-splicing ligase RtcB, partial [Candidatus Woesearchaeota archaeon CG_4_10_14_0_8_um_filter_47_5]